VLGRVGVASRTWRVSKAEFVDELMIM